MPDANASRDKSTSNTPSSHLQNPRRRRGYGIVTPHACTECRRKRAKCDGKTPCSRCKLQDNIECIYASRSRQSKDALRAELAHLRQKEDSTSRVLAVLARPERSNDVMMRFWRGHSLEDVSNWLGQASDDGKTATHPRLDAVLKDVAFRKCTPPPPPPFRTRTSVLWPAGEPETGPVASWTRITSDTDLVQHLLALYFCWEYPTFASLSREHYLRDFHDGRTRYCSALLTNALLAVGSRLSSRAETEGAASAGEHFFGECERLYGESGHRRCLTTVQALGIMAIWEAGGGRVSASEYYAGQCMRLALEMGLHEVRSLERRGEDDSQHRTVELATFWGAFALNNALSFAGSLPRTSLTPSLPINLPTIEALEKQAWIPHTDDDVPLQLPYQQASNQRSVFNLFCQLSELAHQSLYLVHNSSRRLSAQNLLHQYTKYLLWYDELPEVLRLGQNYTPSVLFAHMYYHFATVMLFWPVAEYKIIGTELSPKIICIEAADAITTLLESYARLYTLGRTPSLTPYLGLTAAVVHLASITDPWQKTTTRGGHQDSTLREGSRGFNSLTADVAALEDMTQSHQMARKALGVLALLFQKWGVDIATDAVEISLQDCMDICWPYNRACRSGRPHGFSGEHLDCEMDNQMEQDGRIRTTETTVQSVQHPLFLPLLDLRRRKGFSEEALGRAGFSHLE